MGIRDGTVLCTDLKILGSEALFFLFLGTEQDYSWP